MVKQTLEGAIRTLSRRTYAVADAAGRAGRAPPSSCARTPTRRTTTRSRRSPRPRADGTLLRGEVLARWQEFVGTGELLKSLETRVGWLRDRVVNAVKGKPQQAERVTVAVESGLETLILEHAEAAAERAEAAWRQSDAGARAARRRSGEDLGRASRDLRRRAERAVRDWQQDVLEMVRTEGADKRSTARFLAFGVNGLSVALMIVVFAHTAGVTGAEAGIAGGSAVLGQKLLEAVFGDQAVRTPRRARPRDPSRSRVGALLDAERARYRALLDGLRLEPRAADQLRDAARRVDDLRFAAAKLEQGPRRNRTNSRGRHDALLEGARKLVDPGHRHRRPDRGPRGRGRRPPAAASTTRSSTTPRPSPTARPAGSGCPPTTPSSRSPARPGRASPPPSTR